MANRILLSLLAIFMTLNTLAGDTMDQTMLENWHLFPYVDLTKVELADYDTIPPVVPGEDGVMVRPIAVQADANHFIDIKKIADGFHYKAAAFLFTEIHANEPTTIKIGTSADWFMQWRVNGKEVLSTLNFGNNRYYRREAHPLTDYVIELPLQKGNNLIAVKVLAGSKAWHLYAGIDDKVVAAKPFPYKPLAECLDNPLECIHDEDAVAPYELPELLIDKQGNKVATVEQWEQTRRPEILDDFNNAIYGEIPLKYDSIYYDALVEDDNAIDGLAIRRKVTITVANAGKSLDFPLYIYQPKNTDKPVPVVLLIYARSPNGRWDFNVNSSYWPIRRLVENGFAAASFDRRMLAADNAEHYDEGILALYPGETEKENGWRAISAWAYGAMRCIDYLAADPSIDSEKIAVVGHSRGGKTSLWTAANDPRVAVAFVNDSGCLGAAISRRKMGEHLPGTNISNPHWYTENYKATKDENDLPVDQHMLIALVAPRAVCVASALGDPEADPKGEYLSLVLADPVYELYGDQALIPRGQPGLEKPLQSDRRSYHIRYGNHDMTEYDWTVYIDTARRLFGME